MRHVEVFLPTICFPTRNCTRNFLLFTVFVFNFNCFCRDGDLISAAEKEMKASKRGTLDSSLSEDNLLLEKDAINHVETDLVADLERVRIAESRSEETDFDASLDIHQSNARKTFCSNRVDGEFQSAL